MSASTWFTTHPWATAHRTLLVLLGGLIAALVGAAVAVSTIALTTGSSSPAPAPVPAVHGVPLQPAPDPCTAPRIGRPIPC